MSEVLAEKYVTMAAMEREVTQDMAEQVALLREYESISLELRGVEWIAAHLRDDCGAMLTRVAKALEDRRALVIELRQIIARLQLSAKNWSPSNGSE